MSEREMIGIIVVDDGSGHVSWDWLCSQLYELRSYLLAQQQVNLVRSLRNVLYTPFALNNYEASI